MSSIFHLISISFFSISIRENVTILSLHSAVITALPIMFDGSYRTNKREINYSGASSSSRKSRTANLAVARAQRQARALAKAKLNASIVIQRCWRGVRMGGQHPAGRKGIARALDGRFQMIAANLLNNAGRDNNSADIELVTISASLLAFRMNPALLPFYTSSSEDNDDNNNMSVEQFMRKDLLQLEKLITLCKSQESTPSINPIAARRLISISLLLLRQSISRKVIITDKEEEENRRIISLLNYLIQPILSSTKNNKIAPGVVDDLQTYRPSDYYMNILRGGKNSSEGQRILPPSWMISLFLCLRDFVICYRDNSSGASMEVDDATNPYELELLLKWCCMAILHLASLDQDAATIKNTTSSQSQDDDNDTVSSIPQYQQGIALLASILFIAPSTFSQSWLDKELTEFLRLLAQQNRDNVNTPSGSGSLLWRGIFTHYLSFIIAFGCNTQKHSNNVDQMWVTALRETLNSHECSVLHHTVMQADAHDEQSNLYTYSIPVILQYTLQRHHDLATLATFAARGEDISSWIVDSETVKRETSVAESAATAAYATDDMDVDDDVDDGDEEEEFHAQSAQQQASQRGTQSTSNTTTRYSRQDLQTLPRLDALYQTKLLRDKKATIDRLKALYRETRGSQIEVQCMTSLAERMGKGQWMLQLSNSVFTPTPSKLAPTPSSNGLVPPSQLSLLQTRARECYLSALSSVLISCSGIKAGRNATSPLLAKLGFHNPTLLGLWECSSQNVPLLASSAKNVNPSQIVASHELFSSFCDLFSHHLLAVDDDEFLERYFSNDEESSALVKIKAGDVVVSLKKILNDLYWVNPVLASDISEVKNDSESIIRFQRARLFISGTKLWNSLYERWCRLYRNVTFCDENSWWFPFLAGQHDKNPIIYSQVTTFGDQNDDDEVMEESSVESLDVDEGDAGGDSLASSFRDPKMARVLTAIPQAMPFSRRVNLFQSLIDSDKLLMQDEEATFRHMMMNMDNPDADGEFGGRVRVTIHRDALYNDSMEALNPLKKKLRKKIQVTFVNQHGATEAGIDGGGVFKEFLDDLIKDAFIPQTTIDNESEEEEEKVRSHPDFFSVTPLQTLQVNVDSDGDNSALSHYEFLGRVLGKAIYESILVDPQLALPFLNKLLGKQNSLDDLKKHRPRVL